METPSADMITPQQVSDAARELNEKKQSWNPFKKASAAGKTLEEWREMKKQRAVATHKKVSSALRGQAMTSMKKSAASSLGKKSSGLTSARHNATTAKKGSRTMLKKNSRTVNKKK